MILAHETILQVFEAFIVTTHSKNAVVLYSTADECGVAEKWSTFPIVVETPDDGNVYQGIHFDSSEPSTKACFW